MLVHLRKVVLTAAVLIAAAGTVIADHSTSDADKRITVDLDRQVLIAYHGEELVYEFDSVTGSCAKWTHPGIYKIERKVEDYTSKTYGSKMPYTMFFTDDGKAIHGTTFATIRSYLHAYVTDSVGSKGCVGLGDDDAKTLFEWAPIGTAVIILPSERNPDEVPGLEE